MSKNFDSPVELACPHDGWYNGNPKLMIANGTYADYRHRLETWVEKGKMQASDLAAYDAKWAAIPLDEKKDRRGKVLESIKKVPVRSKDGKVEYVSKPSDNGHASADERKPQLRRQLTLRQPLGSLDTRPDPLAAEEAALHMSHSATLPDKVAGQKGNSVPDSMPGMVVTPPTTKKEAAPSLAASVA